MKSYRCVNSGRKAGYWVVGGDLISRTGSFLVQVLGAVRHSTGCPTRYRTWHFFNNSNINEDIATKQTHTIDTFLFISHTTNLFLFKFLCNILIGFRIIIEMPGLVGSGTLCIWKQIKKRNVSVVCVCFVAISSLVLELLKKCRVR
jgi:hypothetical protein